MNEVNEHTPCDIPPKGWACTREYGHDGPCAAIPTPPPPRKPTCRQLDEAVPLQLIATKKSAIPDHVAIYLILLLMVAGAWMFGRMEGEDQAKAHYERVIKDMGVQHDKALAKQTAEAAATVREIGQRLNTAARQKQETKTIIKEVKTYVTQQSDAACTIPAGFVWLHNQSLAGEAVGVAAGRPADVDAPTGLALSTVAATVADNNAECVERGAVIAAWQDWYKRNKDSYERAAAQMNQAVDGIK